MRFVVDGYNVTKRDPATAARSLEEQRAALVGRLSARGRDLLGAGSLTVVFDGVAGGHGDTRRGALDVRYSRDESADDLIVRIVAAAPEGTTVVTSDRRLIERVEVLGARTVDGTTCFEATRPIRRTSRYPASSVGLPPGANKVTEELKRLWLTGDDE